MNQASDRLHEGHLGVAVPEAIESEELTLTEIPRSEADLLNTSDAMVWAKEFCRLVREGHDATDEGWLVGWFANAMAVGEWKAQKETQ